MAEVGGPFVGCLASRTKLQEKMTCRSCRLFRYQIGPLTGAWPAHAAASLNVMTPDRIAATFLFSDIEGSTRRWAEDAAMADGLARHDEVVQSAIEAADGLWVKHTGDGVLAVFDHASGAAQAAIDIQRSLHQAFADDPMLVRIGLHTGEAERRGDDLFGLEVTTAARIMDTGHGGQVIVSEATKTVLGSSTDDGYELIDLGPHRLKDLGEPQRLFQLAAPGLRGDFPPLRTLEAVDHNLPLQLTTFVGREAELEEIVDLVRSHRLLTLTGVGGAGKTRLSLQAAAELVADFPDGVRLVELASVTDPDAITVAIASVLGVGHEEGAAAGVVDRLLDHLRGRKLLLVIDNCEHVLGAAASVVEKVLASAPDVSILASSREGLGIRGERIWQVPSLEVADGESEASRLFMDRAMSVAPQLAWNEQTRPHIVRICELLDGIPLAIELAAARARVLSPEQISSRLGDRFRLLTGGARSALPRQQTLEATVDWSYQLLSSGERRLFERLAVFVGGFTLEAVEAVCTDAEVETLDVLDLLSGLVDRSMVLADVETSGVSRYRLLETLRQFGIRRLMDQAVLEQWKGRHHRYFLERLESVDVLGWNLRSALPWYATEQGNLSAALEWARSDTAPSVSSLAAALAVHHWLNLGDPEEALSLVNEALDAGDQQDRSLLRLEAARLSILYWIGRVDDFQGAWEALEHRLDGADDEEAAWCLVRAAAPYAWDPALDVARAISMAREAVRRTQDLGPEARFASQMSLGVALIWSSANQEESVPIFREAVAMARALDDPDRIQYALSMLTVVAMTLDQREGTDLTPSVEHEMLELWEESGRARREEWVVWVAIRTGMWDLAQEEIDRQDEEWRGRIRVQMLMSRAVLRWMQGRFEAADSDFDAATELGPIRRRHHDYYPTRAEVAAMQGDREAAEMWARRHFEMSMKPAEEVMRIGTLRALLMAEVNTGDIDAAASTLERIRAIARGHQVPRTPLVQVGSTDFFIAVAEAELTRGTGPDPAAWARAQALSFWVYWTLYCRVRGLEASVALGEHDPAELAAVRTEADSLGAGGLVALLDSFAPSTATID